jgi:hypothetical protein
VPEAQRLLALIPLQPVQPTQPPQSPPMAGPGQPRPEMNLNDYTDAQALRAGVNSPHE